MVGLSIARVYDKTEISHPSDEDLSLGIPAGVREKAEAEGVKKRTRKMSCGVDRGGDEEGVRGTILMNHLAAVLR